MDGTIKIWGVEQQSLMKVIEDPHIERKSVAGSSR